MRHVGTSVVVEAPVSAVWDLLTDFECWPVWGVTIRRVETDAERVAPGVTGRVQTIVGAWLPFEISEAVAEDSWFWTVAGISATRHYVSALGPDRTRIRFTVAWALAPYLAAIRISLVRLKRMAEEDTA